MKSKRLFALLSGLTLLLMLSVCTGCHKELEVQVTMTNGSASDVHLWITGESIDQSNKLAPGASRSAIFSNKDNLTEEEFVITVFAGQNGQVLTSEEYTRNSEASLKVRYAGGALVEE